MEETILTKDQILFLEELKIDELTLGGEFAKVRNLALPIKKIREVSDEELRHFFAEQSVLLRKNVLGED